MNGNRSRKKERKREDGKENERGERRVRYREIKRA